MSCSEADLDSGPRAEADSSCSHPSQENSITVEATIVLPGLTTSTLADNEQQEEDEEENAFPSGTETFTQDDNHDIEDEDFSNLPR